MDGGSVGSGRNILSLIPVLLAILLAALVFMVDSNWLGPGMNAGGRGRIQPSLAYTSSPLTSHSTVSHGHGGARSLRVRGADASMIPVILEHGGRYYENGSRRDPLLIMRDYGVNYLRIRVWVNPYDEDGRPLGRGDCSLRRMSGLAARAKKLGYGLIVDFHYSDWWTDPSRHEKPREWRSLGFNQLVRKVYNYTIESLEYMERVGAKPDMVQVGNEINNGFLWPDGSVNNWTGFVALLKSAVRAVRDYDPSIKIIIHLAGTDTGRQEWLINGLIRAGVDFDIIGLSYYPYHHGSLDKLEEHLEALSTRYPDKLILIVEAAYPWTLRNGDGYPNIAGPGMRLNTPYSATPMGQREYLEALARIIINSTNNRGLGFIYWGGAWIPVEGAGWKRGEGNPWENQALFDFNGNPLPAFIVFHEDIG